MALAPYPAALYLPPLLGLAIAALLIGLISRSGLRSTFLDHPGVRSLHSVPTPRIGGVGMAAGVMCGWVLLSASVSWWLVLPLVALFALSLLDDMYSLSVRVRLSVHLAAAGVFVVGSGLPGQSGILAAILVVPCVVWMINLYNFMDGSDGLAGGMAVSGFACYGIGAWQAGDAGMAAMSFTLVGAALGFLVFNFPKARVFLGDSGSIPLGFLAASLGLLGWLRGYWAIWFPILVFSPFIVDATVTLIKRTVQGERITEPHRGHYYQRMVQLGHSHRRVAGVEFALMIAAGVSALVARGSPFIWPLLSVWLLIYATLAWWLEGQWKRLAS